MFNHSEKMPKAMGETFAAVTAITGASVRSCNQAKRGARR
jgi:hypothetical protein